MQREQNSRSPLHNSLTMRRCRRARFESASGEVRGGIRGDSAIVILEGDERLPHPTVATRRIAAVHRVWRKTPFRGWSLGEAAMALGIALPS